MFEAAHTPIQPVLIGLTLPPPPPVKPIWPNRGTLLDVALKLLLTNGFLTVDSFHAATGSHEARTLVPRLRKAYRWPFVQKEKWWLLSQAAHGERDIKVFVLDTDRLDMAEIQKEMAARYGI